MIISLPTIRGVLPAPRQMPATAVQSARSSNIAEGCQIKHWKHGHKKRCNKAKENRTLRSVLNGGNDYLHITAEECAAMASGLRRCNEKKDPLVKNFCVYFDSAAQLGGCFVG